MLSRMGGSPDREARRRDERADASYHPLSRRDRGKRRHRSVDARARKPCRRIGIDLNAKRAERHAVDHADGSKRGRFPAHRQHAFAKAGPHHAGEAVDGCIKRMIDHCTDQTVADTQSLLRSQPRWQTEAGDLVDINPSRYIVLSKASKRVGKDMRSP